MTVGAFSLAFSVNRTWSPHLETREFSEPGDEVRNKELPSIGWQLFILESSQSDSIAIPSCLDTYATRLLTEPLRRSTPYSRLEANLAHPARSKVAAIGALDTSVSAR